ncbi:MAG: hypothetical protein PHG20_02625 [Geobacteraceae bacterium]|nr:hypothetical protein [Geobacteraceae bacterium]
MKKTQVPAMTEVSSADEAGGIALAPTARQIARLCTLIQKDCFVKIECGCSMRNVLCEQFGITPEYVKSEIKVFFLNNSPVDDIDDAIVRDGSTMALSAAMPGLVGASMRQGGLSWMRSGITYHEDGEVQGKRMGVIQLKLFNQVMADLGEAFLKRGLYVKTGVLAAFFARFSEDFWSECGNITKNSESVTGSTLMDYLKSSDEWVKFSIR